MNDTQKKLLLLAAAVAPLAGIAIWAVRRRRAGFRTPISALGREPAWRFDQRFRMLPAGHDLEIELQSPAIVHWTTNQWDTTRDTRTREAGLNVHAAQLDTAELPSGTRIQFTFYWPRAGRWEGEDFEVRVAEATEPTVRSATERGD